MVRTSQTGKGPAPVRDTRSVRPKVFYDPERTGDHAEHVRRQSMAETIAALRANGLVTSEPDPGDRRKTLITAIGKGRQLSATIPAAREAWLSSAVGTLLDADEQQILLKAAAIINRIADSHP